MIEALLEISALTNLPPAPVRLPSTLGVVALRSHSIVFVKPSRAGFDAVAPSWGRWHRGPPA